MGYICYPYRIPLTRGLTDNANQTQRFPADLEVAKNITLHENNIQRDFGEANISSSLSAAIRAGVDYFPVVTTQKTVIYTGDGKLQKADGAGSGAWTVLKTGLNGVKVGQLVLAGQELAANNRRLFLFNGYDYPQYLTGDGTTTERIGFIASLTNKLSSDISGSGGFPATAIKVNLNLHGFRTGDTISLVGFSNVGGVSPNIENSYVNKIDDNNFYY